MTVGGCSELQNCERLREVFGCHEPPTTEEWCYGDTEQLPFRGCNLCDTDTPDRDSMFEPR